MKPLRPLLLTLGLAALFSVPASGADAGFKDLFNGKDLTGWEGLLAFWSVKDGAITGQTTAENKLAANTFLVLKDQKPANFELRLKFKLTPTNPGTSANSGVQFRSKVFNAETFAVSGYQADIDSAGRYAGMLYEERGRGIMMAPGEKIKVGETVVDPNTQKKKTNVEKLAGATTPADVKAAYKIGEWNDFKVIANGNHIQQFMNGTLTADVIDTDATLAAKDGVIALQLHTGAPMTVQFKDLQLKTLP